MACVESRELTGVGFFTNFAIPSDVNVPRTVPDQVIGGVGAKLSGLQHGAGFLLFVREGRIAFLEGFCYDEDWTDPGSEFTLIDAP